MSKKIGLAPARKKNASLFLDCFRGVTVRHQYRNKWIASDVWVDIINSHYDISDDLKFSSAQLNTAVSRNAQFKSNLIETTTAVVSPMGLYKASYKVGKEGKKVHVVGYYATSPNTLPTPPGGSTKWYHDIASLLPRETRSMSREENQLENLDDLRSPKEGSMSTMVPTTRKRRGDVIIRNGNDGTFTRTDDPQRAMKEACIRVESKQMPREEMNEESSASDEPQPFVPQEDTNQSAAADPPSTSWWDSTNAFSLFGERQEDDEDEDANDDEDAWNLKATVRKRIERLRRGHTTVGGWKLTLDDFDTRDICSANDIFNIQMKCKYLCVALGLALERMPLQTWRQCCNDAVIRVNDWEGHEHIKNGETVRIWHFDFRASKECFRNPNVYKRNGKAPLPPMLDRNPDFARSVIKFAKRNLNDLSAEMMCNYLHTTALPELLRQRQEELDDKDFDIADLLRENRLTKLTLETVYRWLDRLGFKYEARKKGYYVDNHEKPETVSYRRHFVKRYLEYEKRMFRWLQLPLAKVKEMEEMLDIDKGLGYRYTDSTTYEEMVEFHVDQHPSFQDSVSTIKYGGNLSVRKPVGIKPLICFGQDECIFKQFTFTPKAWTAPDGQKSMIPKDEGLGVMISAFVSREFGFGYFISIEDLEKVNKKREGKHYSDELASKKIKGNTMKAPLTESPFVVEFEYGANNQGYWDYDHMIMQFEDCIDVVTTLHPEFEFLFLFDHSCGHDRQRPDGLSVTKVNKTAGGVQPKMRQSKMETEEFLGPFPATLQVGDCQQMVFQDGDMGPFYKSELERAATKFDRRTGASTSKMRKKEAMQNDLKAKGVSAKGNKVAIVELCKQNNVPYKVVTETIKEGWQGKPKGMLQILWERGFIEQEPSKAESFYTNDGKKDAFGNLIPGTSLRKMMSELIDFIQEETLLQYHGKTLGVIVDRSPKCHPEVAGEGIEYSWGCAKGKYRRLPLSDKRRKDNFRNSVRQCMDTSEVLTIDRQRMFSKRARQYMLAYHSIETSKEKSESGATGESKVKLEMSAYLVEKIIKTYKSHRGATDFDSAYIRTIVNDMKSGDKCNA